MNVPVSDLFAGDASNDFPSVGIELELFPLRAAKDGTVPTVAAIAETASALGDLPYVAFEPGGQLELNAPPSSTAAGAIDAVQFLHDEAAARLHGQGVDLLAIGLDPWHDGREVVLQMDNERYQMMDAHYASIGPEGRSFMRQTASTQICVGLRPGAEGSVQWHAANRIAPLLAAAFANAPARRGRPLHHNGGRTAVIAQADPSRHRLDWIAREPCRAYADFAAAAAPIGPAFAGPGALAAHLTTLFPPVRPRGTYLEVRSVDAVAGDDLATAVVLTTALLASTRAARALLTRLPLSVAADHTRWSMAAGAGVRNAAIASEVVELVDLALDAAVHDLPLGYLHEHAVDLLGALRARVARGRAPGDVVLARGKAREQAPGLDHSCGSDDQTNTASVFTTVTTV